MFQITIPKNKYDSPKFARYVLAKMINDTQSLLSRSSYKRTDPALRSYLGYSGEDSSVSSYGILTYYIRGFHVTEDDDNFYIRGSDTENVGSPDQPRPISRAVQLMEYGATGVPPVPRLTKVINDISQNIDNIYNNYIKMRKR